MATSLEEGKFWIQTPHRIELVSHPAHTKWLVNKYILPLFLSNFSNNHTRLTKQGVSKQRWSIQLQESRVFLLTDWLFLTQELFWSVEWNHPMWPVLSEWPWVQWLSIILINLCFSTHLMIQNLIWIIHYMSIIDLTTLLGQSNSIWGIHELSTKAEQFDWNLNIAGWTCLSFMRREVVFFIKLASSESCGNLIPRKSVMTRNIEPK